MKLKQKVPWIRKSPTGHCVWNTAVMFPFFKFACSGEFPGTMGPLPELAFAKKKALLSCYNFLQHCSQIQTPFTRHKYYLKNIVLGCPSRKMSNVLSWTSSKGKWADDVIMRLSLFRLANVSLFLVESIVISFLIYWWTRDLVLVFLFASLFFRF